MVQDSFAARQVKALRADYENGKLPRYIVRCGLEKSGRVQVHDCAGGWVCSTHKNLAMAQKRADALNAEATEWAKTHPVAPGWKSLPPSDASCVCGCPEPVVVPA